MVDDNTAVLALSTVNGSRLRGVQGVVGDGGAFMFIGTMTLQQLHHPSTPYSLLWLSVFKDDGVMGVPSLVVLRSDDFSVVTLVSTFSPATSDYFSALSTSPDGASVLALSRGWVYAFNSTGHQLRDGMALPDRDAMLMAVAATAASPLTLFIVSAEDDETTLSVCTDERVLSSVDLALPEGAQAAWQLHVDSQKRVWLIDTSDMVYLINSSTGGVLRNFSTTVASIFNGTDLFPWYHQFVLSADGTDMWVTTYGAEDIVVKLSTMGNILSRWRSDEAVVFQPAALQVDDTTRTPTLLIADSIYNLASSSVRRLSLSGGQVQVINVSYPGDRAFRPYAFLVDDGHGSRAGDSVGDVYVFSSTITDSPSTTYRLNGEGQLLASFSSPYGRAAVWDRSDDEASYWLTDWEYGSVGRYTLQGKRLVSYNLSTSAFLNGLAESCKGRDKSCTLFVARSGDGRIDLLNTTDGKRLGAIDQSSGAETVTYLALDASYPLLYAVHCFLDSIYIDNCSIRVQTTAGHPLAVLRVEPGYSMPLLLSPSLNADGSRLFASDFTHNRVVSWNTTEFQHIVSRMSDAGGALDGYHHISHRPRQSESCHRCNGSELNSLRDGQRNSMHKQAGLRGITVTM